MRWSLADGCGFEFGTVAVVPPFEMEGQVGGGCAPPLEMLRSRVVCSAALSCCVAAVNLILTVNFRVTILEVDCHRRPQ